MSGNRSWPGRLVGGLLLLVASALVVRWAADVLTPFIPALLVGVCVFGLVAWVVGGPRDRR